MDSICYSNLLINFTSEFTPLWNDKGAGSTKPVSFWRPVASSDFLNGFYPLGDLAVGNYDNINRKRIVAVASEAPLIPGAPRLEKALSAPVEYELVWNDSGSRAHTDGAIWRPIPPEGYVALGLVCGTGHDKPSRNAIRCVRADLVIASYISDLIWNDRGSGAQKDFSAWSISPPGAASGEAYFSAGTFVGADSYTKPSTHVAAYSLRMQIRQTVSSAPPAPALPDYRQPSPFEAAHITHTCEIPWFTVKDPNLRPAEQLFTSPTYRLERTDRYVLVGFGHNKTSINQTFKWTATRGENGGKSKTLTETTSIEVGGEWQFNLWGTSIKFSAKLSKGLTHTETSSSGWVTSTAFEIAAAVPANKAVAVYLIQSDYRLLRENGTQVATDVSYTDGDSVYWSEYPPTRECQVTCNALPEPTASTRGSAP
ncbi:Vps62-related protein [Pseudomonas fluorescens]|uniref:Vps62-related protein n=1 Tax=Pseudomonas fluorescens TaxID=294 RepID=UPI001FD42E2C|nr:Vps62-related protein [Pseudomonas fluorescens]MDY0896758.1 Vps62-related protein [Pseudomonas fluorescens]